MLQDIYVREKLAEAAPLSGKQRPVGKQTGITIVPLLHSVGGLLCSAGERLQSVGSASKFDTRGKKLGAR